MLAVQLALAALFIAGLPYGVDCATFGESCTALASTLQSPDVHVQFTQYVAAGTELALPDYPRACVTGIGASPFQVVRADICRVALLIKTSSKSNMTLEAWLPSNWTGRFLSGGNGGYTGCMQYSDLSYGSSLGFATVSGNNGHNGTSASAFYKQPEVLKDYAYRAIYTGATIGKKAAQLLYGKPPATSYFMGCSGGGRQGLKFAQEFPEVFDGIVSAGPAINFINLINWGGWLSTIAGFDAASPEFIDMAKWNAIHQEIIRQCDGLDGAIDGILEDPDLCNPKFEALVCKGTGTDWATCLSGTQAARVRQVFQPLYGISGTLLYPRLQPGGELLAYSSYLNSTPSLLASDWYRYVVYNPSYDPRRLRRADFAVANAADPYGISTWKADLSGFKKRGGKLLMLQGFEDGVISSENSDLFYHRVAETMSLSPPALDEFYRYFRISSMALCAPGSGAWNVGMYPNGNSTSTAPEDNVLTGIVDWVEQGHAPEFIRGTKFINQSPAQGIEYTRKHCKYPARNMYVGPQNSTVEDAWRCV